MVTRSYGQYCGFARALEVVGERWALLIVRDLLVGPKRFSEILRGLPKIPSNILTARLKELEVAGIVYRRTQARPQGGFVYELTQRGRELEDTVIALGRWGARELGDRRPAEVVTDDSIAMALRTIFRPEVAASDDVAFEVRLGDVVANARVRNGKVNVGRGSLIDPDLIIETGPELRELLSGDVTPQRALQNGTVRLRGKRALLNRFVQLFRI